MITKGRKKETRTALAVAELSNKCAPLEWLWWLPSMSVVFPVTSTQSLWEDQMLSQNLKG